MIRSLMSKSKKNLKTDILDALIALLKSFDYFLFNNENYFDEFLLNLYPSFEIVDLIFEHNNHELKYLIIFFNYYAKFFSLKLTSNCLKDGNLI